jgi:hypothetical protein
VYNVLEIIIVDPTQVTIVTWVAYELQNKLKQMKVKDRKKDTPYLNTETSKLV